MQSNNFSDYRNDQILMEMTRQQYRKYVDANFITEEMCIIAIGLNCNPIDTKNKGNIQNPPNILNPPNKSPKLSISL